MATATWRRWASPPASISTTCWPARASPFGQSPFAIGRGLAFEKLLRRDDHLLARELLAGVLGVAAADARVVNLRQGYPKSSDGMRQRGDATLDLLRRILAGDPAAPHLIDGAVLSAPVGGMPAYFEADALAARSRVEVRVAEVKSFPKVDERVDPEKLGAALDQVSVYLLLLRTAVALLGGDPERLVSDRALLITPRNVGLQPTLSEQRVSARMGRIQKLLDKLPQTADIVAAAPAGLSFGPVADRSVEEERRIAAMHDLADRVGTAYGPGCLTTCGNARFCRQRAFDSAAPALCGTGTVRLLPGVLNLYRADELSRGAAPADGEAPAAALLERAGRLYDEASAPAVERRPA